MKVFETYYCDVLVIGGGASGVATAVIAARQGLNVVLLERYGFCGGGAVAGYSGTVCGIYAANESSSPPEQLVFGFLDEFLSRLRRNGGLGDPVVYGKTTTHVHHPDVWKYTADQLLLEVGVRIFYHTRVYESLFEGEKIEGVISTSKQGPLEFRAKITVDASGDADVIHLAGLPYSIGDNGKVQNPTMMFRLAGVDDRTFMKHYGPDTIMGTEVIDLINEKHDSGAYFLPRKKIFMFPTGKPGELLCNCTRVIGRDGRELNVLGIEDFTEAEHQGRFQAFEYARFFKDHLKGCENSYLSMLAPQFGVPQTRNIKGKSTLQIEDVVEGRKHNDGIARCAWPIELHSGEKPRVEWLIDDYYEIPYGCFVPEKGENILVTGRCLSASHESLASARVTAQCFSYGHAIGHAAALAVKDNLSPADISGETIRDILNKENARLG